MRRTRIKFCGIRSVDDAQAACESGADAIGLIFAPQAKRRIDMDVAVRILQSLPAFVTPVGLFSDQPLDEVIHTCSALGLRHVQLHGRETLEHVTSLAPRTVLKAVQFSGPDALAGWKVAPSNLCGMILEAPGSSGGSGLENDWQGIESAQARGEFSGLAPIILAGGLTCENVGRVVTRLRPYAVDVSSGIESEWGKKSVEKMRAFVRQVQAADATV